MQLIQSFKNKYVSVFWFRYIFLNNKYLLFYYYDFCNSYELLKLRYFCLDNGLGFKLISNLNSLLNLNGLSKHYILIYFNEFSSELDKISKKIFPISLFIYNKYIINNIYYSSIILNCKFYKKNYNYIIMYLDLLTKTFFIIVRQLQKSLLLNIYYFKNII